MPRCDITFEREAEPIKVGAARRPMMRPDCHEQERNRAGIRPSRIAPEWTRGCGACSLLRSCKRRACGTAVSLDMATAWVVYAQNPPRQSRLLNGDVALGHGYVKPSLPCVATGRAAAVAAEFVDRTTAL